MRGKEKTALNRQVDNDVQPTLRAVIQPHLPAMAQNDVLNDGKAQPHPAGAVLRDDRY